jgi:5'-nucleotidase
MTKLPIIHWNDVYKVTPQKISSTETIDVTQFAALMDEIRDQWTQRSDGKRDGLTLFSGGKLQLFLSYLLHVKANDTLDVFSPSVESTVTRGSHMVTAKLLVRLW